MASRRAFGLKKFSILNVLLLFLILSQISIYHLVRGGFGSGDDGSYISHTMSFGLDNDADYTNEIAKRRTNDGLYPSHGFGGAIVIFPITYLGSLLDRFFDSDIISDRRYTSTSWTFLTFLLSKIFLYYGTVLLIYKSCQESMNSSDKLLIGYVVFGAASYYFFQRFTMAHAEEIFLTSLVIYITIIHLIQKPISILAAFFLSITMAVSLLTKASNIPILVIPLAIGLLEGVDRKRISILVISSVLSIIMSELVKYIYYDNYPVTSEYLFGRSIDSVRGLPSDIIGKLEFLVFNIKSYFLIMFSSEYGILFTNPVVCVAIFLMLYKALSRPFCSGCWVALIIFAFTMSIIVFWQSNGTDYGFRYLLYLTPFSVYIIYSISRARLFLICFVAISCFAVINYKSSSVLSPAEGVNLFGRYEITQNSDYLYDLLYSLFSFKVWVVTFGKGIFSGLIVMGPGFLLEPVLAFGGDALSVIDLHASENSIIFKIQILTILFTTVFMHYLIFGERCSEKKC